MARAAPAPVCLLACLLAWAVPVAAFETLARERAVTPGETLMDVARANGLGYVELLAANPGIDPWLPPQDTRLTLPGAHLAPSSPLEGLVVNLGDMRLYFRPPGGEPLSFPIGIGREGWALKPGRTRIVGKRRDPTWVPPASIRAERPDLPASVPPGPDNPLGAYSIDLALGTVRIHGTNKPDGVGRRVSHGCFRLYPEDVETLFGLVEIGQQVTIVDEPVKLAWHEGELYLEIHPTQAQADAVEARRDIAREFLPGLWLRVAEAAGPESGRVDWRAVEWAALGRTGIPVRVTAK